MQSSVYLLGNGETDEHGLSSDLRMDEYDTDAGVEALSSAHGAATTGPEISDDEGSDAEENAIEATDMVLLAARTDDDSSVLEVHCYDPLTGNLWVHHDLALGAFPLCTAFLDVPPLGANANGTASAGDAGAYVAVGTFKPGIEIWNLDVLDPLEPSAILGGEDPNSGGSKKGGKKKKKLSLRADSHTDAVMGLAWNRLQRQVVNEIATSSLLPLHLPWPPLYLCYLFEDPYKQIFCFQLFSLATRLFLAAMCTYRCWRPGPPIVP